MAKPFLMHDNFKIMELTREKFHPYCDLIYDIYKTKGSFFGEEKKFQETFYIAASSSLVDIANYAKEVNINITELDAIKILVFSISHLQKINHNIIIERYIRSIFSYLEKKYQVSFNRKELGQSIKVCEKLIESNQIISIYTFVKGMQEGAKAERNV